MVQIIVVSILAFCLLLGFVIGLFKGFNKTNAWATEFILAALCTILFGALARNSQMDPRIAGPFVLALTVILSLVFIGLTSLLKRLINRSFERREEAEKSGKGAVGVFNRLYGGVTLAVKGATIALLILVPVLAVFDIINLPALSPYFSPFFSLPVWAAVKPFIFDFLIIGLLQAMMRHGFSSGISSALWGLVILGLSVGAGFLAYYIVFGTGLFASASEALANNLSGALSSVNLSGGIILTVAKAVITAGVFLVLFIVVIILSFVVSRVLRFARLGKTFYVVDGICGATVLFILMLAVLLFLGYVLEPLYSLEFMSPINSYFDNSSVGVYFYKNNLLYQYGMPELIPIRQWLT